MHPIFAKALAGKLISCFLVSFAYATPISVTTSPNAAIPDNNSVGIISVANLSNPDTVNSIDVSVALTHTWVGDLIVRLTHGSNSVTLLNKPGASSPTGAGDSSNLIASSPLNFSDTGLAAASTLGSGCTSLETVGVSAGCLNLSFMPDTSFSTFIGNIAAGDWELTVIDTMDLDRGTLVNWTLNLDVGPANPVPLPTTLALLGFGAIGLLRLRR